VSVGGLPSLGRYTAVLFPIFLFLGTLSSRTVMILLGLFLLGQAFVGAMFFTWRPLY
jgi:hypothetical protein